MHAAAGAWRVMRIDCWRGRFIGEFWWWAGTVCGLHNCLPHAGQLCFLLRGLSVLAQHTQEFLGAGDNRGVI